MGESTDMKKLRKGALYAGLMLCFLFSALPAAAAETESELTDSAGEEITGIISAMDNEIALLLQNAEIDHVERRGSMDFHVGTLCGKNVVIVKGGIGKVRSAAGAAALLDSFGPARVIFTGIAGGVSDETQVLDVVVAEDLVQHDYGIMSNDGFEWSEGTGGENCRVFCDPELVRLAHDAAAEVVGEEHVFQGTIVTGDQFIASESYVELLQENFKAMACEMEGASVGIVCTEYEVPFVVIRTMSDKADGLAHDTYENMADLAADHSSEVVMQMLKNM
jgi:adenosylhomocysteine nucleosidase